MADDAGAAHHEAASRVGEELSQMVGSAEQRAADTEREARQHAATLRSQARAHITRVADRLEAAEGVAAPVVRDVNLEAERLRGAIQRAERRWAGPPALGPGHPEPPAEVVTPDRVESAPAEPEADAGADAESVLTGEDEPVIADVIEERLEDAAREGNTPRPAVLAEGRSEAELAGLFEMASQSERAWASPEYLAGIREAVLAEAMARDDFGRDFTPAPELSRKQRKQQTRAVKRLAKAARQQRG